MTSPEIFSNTFCGFNDKLFKWVTFMQWNYCTFCLTLYITFCTINRLTFFLSFFFSFSPKDKTAHWLTDFSEDLVSTLLLKTITKPIKSTWTQQEQNHFRFYLVSRFLLSIFYNFTSFFIVSLKAEFSKIYCTEILLHSPKKMNENFV